MIEPMPKPCKTCRFWTARSQNFRNKCVHCDEEGSHWVPMTAAQQLEREMTNNGTKLYGDISGGYVYVSTDGKIDNATKEILEQMNNPYYKQIIDYCKYGKNRMSIKDVIFNDPATIVLWADGTKTVVKRGKYDIYDPEKGLAMCIAKKAFGNEGNYYNVFRKYLEQYEATIKARIMKFLDSYKMPETASEHVNEAFESLKTEQTIMPGIEKPEEKPRWKIWFRLISFNSNIVHPTQYYSRDYSTKYNAERRARRMFAILNADNEKYEWKVSQTNPWEEE